MSLVAIIAVLVVGGLSIFAMAEVNRSKDCVNTHISSGEKVRRCANGYVGLTLDLAKKKAEKNNLYPLWKTVGDDSGIILDFRAASIMFEIKYGIVVNAYIDRYHSP